MSRIRKITTSIVVTMVAAAVSVVGLATPASAATHPYPSSLSGCSHYSIVDSVDLVDWATSTFVGYGTMEYSSYGNCNGYQWVDLTLNQSICTAGVYGDTNEALSLNDVDGVSNTYTWAIQPFWLCASGEIYLPAGNFITPMTRVYGNKLEVSTAGLADLAFGSVYSYKLSWTA